MRGFLWIGEKRIGPKPLFPVPARSYSDATLSRQRQTIMNGAPDSIRRFVPTIAAIALAASLAACATPGHIAPQARPVDISTVLPQPSAPVSVADTWWTAYGDPALDALVVRGLSGNPTLAVVRARVEHASAEVGEADAQRQPHVDATADIARQRFTGTGLYSPLVAGTSQTTADLGLRGSWEIDVFGKRRALLDAAIGSQRAAEADFQAARVLLAANIVHQYVQLARLGDQREVLARALAQRQEVLALLRQRVDAGLDTAVELRQGEGAVPEIRVALDQVDEQAEIARDALAALTGQGPDALRSLSPRLAVVKAVPLPDDIPADLLGRRADITAARWRVESATQDLKAARAEFYPSVNLLAFAGFTSIGLDNLLHADSRQLGAGPALSLPIFDAGRLRANYKSKSTDVDGAVETYNTAVLEALRDTADALASVRHTDVQRADQARALDSAEQAYDLAAQRYGNGLGSYLTVLAAETNVLAQRRIDADLKAKALDSQAQLARALGGGYVQGNVAGAQSQVAIAGASR
jgi:NodT family efflux transporter outer membrane factor (OMF) lipoprotein